jgi:hypothetical protein
VIPQQALATEVEHELWRECARQRQDLRASEQREATLQPFRLVDCRGPSNPGTPRGGTDEVEDGPANRFRRLRRNLDLVLQPGCRKRPGALARPERAGDASPKPTQRTTARGAVGLSGFSQNHVGRNIAIGKQHCPPCLLRQRGCT